MYSTSVETFQAQAVIGLYRGFSDDLIPMPTFEAALLAAQCHIRDQYQIILSVCVTPCTIYCLGQQ